MQYPTSKLFRKLGAMFILLAAVFLVPLIEPIMLKANANAADAAADANAYSRQRSVYQTLASGQMIPQKHVYDKPDRPTVYLTFDDGPSVNTPKVLDILHKENIQATFFVLGSAAQKQPKLIKRILAEGHSLGNHTFNHVYKQLYASFEEYWKQTQQTETVLNEIAGVRPTLLRAPGGTSTNFDAFYFHYLEQAGYQVFDWNIDSGDSKRRNVPASEIVSTVKKGPFKHEICVLMHDGVGHEQTVKALPEIIRIYKQKGYTFAPITDKVKPITFRAGKVKWARTGTTESMYNRTMAMVSKYAADHGVKQIDTGQQQPRTDEPPLTDHGVKQIDTGQQQPRTDEPPLTDHGVKQIDFGQQQPRTDEPPLTIALKNKGKLTLGSEQYDLRKGRFYVPLRELMEQIGGRVSWNSSRQTATVTYGSYAVQYDLSSKTMKIMTSDQSEHVSYMSEMVVQEGNLMVPLRYTVELFHNEITQFSLSPGHREVQIDLTNGHGSYLAIGKFVPDTLYAAAAYADEVSRSSRAFAMALHDV